MYEVYKYMFISHWQSKLVQNKCTINGNFMTLGKAVNKLSLEKALNMA